MKNKEYPVFPIQNDTACVNKWGWSTFRLYTGESSSCHRVKSVYVPVDKFETFHNTPEVINDRKLMSENSWPGRGCEYCEKVERAGGVSDRIYHNMIPGLTPVDFTTDPETPVTPRTLEVFLHNTCDLACVYCVPIFSSKINSELLKFGTNELGMSYLKVVDDRELYYQKFANWVEANASKLDRLSIQGGEPLLQKEFWHLLELFSKQHNSNLEVSINTNLNCSDETLDKFLNIAHKLLSEKHLRAISINCSLDNWGAQAEFVRYGLSVDTWQKNFEKLIQHKWLNITVQQVLSSLTIPTAMELHRRIIDYKQVNNKIMQAYHLVDGKAQSAFHPEIFGAGFFSNYLNELISTYPVHTAWDETAKSRLVGIAKLLETGDINLVRLELLKKFLTQLDDRRGTDWKLLFPEIDNFFIKHNI